MAALRRSSAGARYAAGCAALEARESAFELHANGGIPRWRDRLRTGFERYNELANGVLRQLSVPMPDIDMTSIRAAAMTARRVVDLGGKQ